MAKSNQTAFYVDAGVIKMREGVDGLTKITQANHWVNETSRDISTETNEQASAGNQIPSNMEQVALAAEQNIQLAQQLSGIAKVLNKLTVKLKLLMDEFELIPHTIKYRSAGGSNGFNLF